MSIETVSKVFLDKLYNVKITNNNLYTKLSISKFEKDIIELFIKDHLDGEKINYFHKNEMLITLFHHLYNIDKEYITIFFRDIDCYMVELSDVVHEVYITTNEIINVSVIQETFISLLSRILLNHIFKNENLNKLDRVDIYVFLYINCLDNLVDNNNNNNNKALNYLRSWLLNENEVMKNYIHCVERIFERENDLKSSKLNKDEKIRDHFYNRLELISEYFKILYPELDTPKLEKFLYSTASIVIILDDLIDIKKDIKEKNSNSLIDYYNPDINNIDKYESYIYKMLLILEDYKDYMSNSYVLVSNYSSVLKQFASIILKMFTSIVINIMGIGLIHNSEYYNYDFKKMYNTICYIPLNIIQDHKFSSNKYYGNILNYMNFHIIQSYKYKVDSDIGDIFNYISDDIDCVKSRLLNIISQYDNNIHEDILYQSLKYSIMNPGKMIRSVLVIYIYNLIINENKSEISKDKILSLCVSIELIHLASLIHDDIIDDADIRRSNESVNHKFGNKIAVMLGDYLVMESIKNLINTESIKDESIKDESIISDSIQLSQRLIRGEVNEFKNVYKPIGIKTYIQNITDKTSYFVSWIMKIAGKLCDATPEQLKSLEIIGNNIGIVFQITDDILDYNGNEEDTGKPVFNDIIKGIVTAPYIFAMEESSDLSIYLSLIEKDNIKKEKIKEKLIKYGFEKHIESSYKLATQFMEESQIELYKAFKKDTVYRENINRLMIHILNRKK